MLYIKNRRIYTDSFSFELPEDLCLISDPPTVAPDTLHFETLDGLFEIEIGAWDGDNSPYDQLLDECLYSEAVLLSTIFEVERDGMKGFGAYYHSAEWTYVIHFIFSLTLRCEIKNRKVHTLSIIMSFRSTVGFRQSFPGGVHIDYSLRYVILLSPAV